MEVEISNSLFDTTVFRKTWNLTLIIILLYLSMELDKYYKKY